MFTIFIWINCFVKPLWKKELFCIFLCLQVGIAVHWESSELNSAHQTCLFPYVTWWLFRVKSFFSFLCPFCPVFFLHACLVEAIDAFLVLADNRCGFACQGLGSLWILPRLLPAPTKLDFICPARVCISPECISTVFQKFFQELFPLCILTWGVRRHSLSNLSRGAQWWALFRILKQRSTYGRSGGITGLMLWGGEKQGDVKWLWAHLHGERGRVGSQTQGLSLQWSLQCGGNDLNHFLLL